MCEGVPGTSYLPVKVGQEVVCREGSVRGGRGSDEEGREGGETFTGV